MLVADTAQIITDPRALVRAGIGAVMRYPLGNDAVTIAERDRCLEAGLGFGLACELSPTAALGGKAQGQIDADRFGNAATALDWRTGLALYFAADFNPAGVFGRCVSYYEGTAEVRHRMWRNGAYAGAGLLNACFAAKAIDLGWDVGARSWDDGQTCSRAGLQQIVAQMTVAGQTVDEDIIVRAHSSLSTDLGIWMPEEAALGPFSNVLITPNPDHATDPSQPENLAVNANGARGLVDWPSTAWLFAHGAVSDRVVLPAGTPTPTEIPASLLAQLRTIG
jgi:hypothetical protein